MDQQKSNLVSVIIPTFNRAYCLSEAIDSVLAQTHERLEILVVDDGSTDNTAALITARYEHEPRVHYHYQENAGVSAARNTGFSLAKGDYIALLDSDDHWDPWKLELQLAAFASRPDLGMIWTDMRAVNPNGKVISERYLRKMYSAHKWFPTDQLFPWSVPAASVAPGLAAQVGKAKFYAGCIFSQMVAGNLAHTSTVLMTRERVEKVGGMKVEYSQAGEDYEFYVRICLEGPVGFLDLPTISYQHGREDQVTTTCTLPVARNYLATVTSALAEHREKITLSQKMINLVLADAHLWLGSELVGAKQCAEGRAHLVEALRRDFTWSAFRCLVASYLPSRLVPHVRTGLKHARTMTDIRLWSVFLLLHVNLAADLIDMESLNSLTTILG